MFSRAVQHPAMNRRVLISLLSDNAVSGVLTAILGDEYVLKDCSIHAPRQEPTPADGEILINLINIDFVQIL